MVLSASLTNRLINDFNLELICLINLYTLSSLPFGYELGACRGILGGCKLVWGKCDGVWGKHKGMD